MEAIRIESLSFAYPESPTDALSGISCCIEAGEFVVLCGPSGCGKTTLLRHLKPALAPHGSRRGRIFLESSPLEQLDFLQQSQKIGFVLQAPERQLVTDKVWHELAFGLESLGLPQEAIRLRVSEMAAFFGMEDWFHLPVSQLSGGQKQLLNLASVLAMQPSVLLLDEPTSQLDPMAAQDFLSALHRINRELGTTVLLSEHRLEEALPLADRVLVLDGGRLAADAPPSQAGQLLRSRGHAMFLAMPSAMRIYAGLPSDLPCPVTVREGRRFLDALAKTTPPSPLPEEAVPEPAGTPALALEEVFFRYEKDAPDVLRGLSLSLYPGELLALMGGNGSGKSTALSLASGLRRPQRGRIRWEGKELAAHPAAERYFGLLGVLPQDPQCLFLKDTLGEDLADALRGRGLSKPEEQSRLREVLALCRLEGLEARHPYDLSGGEQQRAALAKILLGRPRILLLDEPTKGLDAAFKEELGAILTALRQKGTAILMVSHDTEFCARWADRCALLFDGAVTAAARPRQFFHQNNFFTTASDRMSRHLGLGAITPEQVIRAFGGSEVSPPPPQAPDPPEEPPRPPRDPDPKPEPTPEPGPEKVRRPFALAAVLLFCSIPVTLLLGLRFEGNHYLLSFLVLAEALLPFALLFEGRKPRPRDLILIAVLCALGVAGRAIFFMAPQFKPVAALVILAGAAFGGRTGFLVGAVTMFASNLLMGQGPWTPWQLLAMGLIGLLAGALFHRRSGRSPRRLPLCIFGFVGVLVIYGGIMDPASILMAQDRVTWPMIASALTLGLPFNLAHGTATVFFLWVFSSPMLKKLARVKRKYGMLGA